VQPSFPGFPEEGLKFLRSLKKNNNREWFQPRKEIFDQYVKAPMIDLVTAVERGMWAFAPDFATIEPAKAIYRIYRDTRFSSDKTPYKTHIAASLRRRDMGRHSPGFYFDVSPDHVHVGGGAYMLDAAELIRIRYRMASDHKIFKRIVEEKELKRLFGEIQGDRLSRVPKGFAADHPAAEWLKLKQCYVYIELDGRLASSPELITEILAHFKATTPLIEFLADAIRPRED
jgi:uncharacterized protein (TIGR02453 family)